MKPRHVLELMAQDFLSGERVLAFDLETTGISTSKDRIVQIALIGADSDGSQIHFESLVNPQRPIPFPASNVHGIYDADVRGIDPYSSISGEVSQLIDGAVIIGHNVRKFDMPMLETEYFRLGKVPPKPKAVLDTFELVKRLKVARPHNLGALCSRYGISLENAHTAGADAAASMLLLWRLSTEYPSSFRRSLKELELWLMHGEVRDDASDLGRGINALECVDELGKIRRDGEHLIIAFGRNKGRSVGEVEADDPAYIDWMLSPNGITDEIARLAIKEVIAKSRDSSQE